MSTGTHELIDWDPKELLARQVLELMGKEQEEETKRNVALGKMLYLGLQSGLSGKELEAYVEGMRKEAGVAILFVQASMAPLQFDESLGMEPLETLPAVPVSRSIFRPASSYNFTIGGLLDFWEQKVRSNSDLSGEMPPITQAAVEELLEAFFHDRTQANAKNQDYNNLVRDLLENSEKSDQMIKPAMFLRGALANRPLEKEFLKRHASLLLPSFDRARIRRTAKNSKGVDTSWVEPIKSNEYFVLENISIGEILLGLLSAATESVDEDTMRRARNLLSQISGTPSRIGSIIIDG